jgi:glucose uptake protein GlcU
MGYKIYKHSNISKEILIDNKITTKIKVWPFVLFRLQGLKDFLPYFCGTFLASTVLLFTLTQRLWESVLVYPVPTFQFSYNFITFMTSFRSFCADISFTFSTNTVLISARRKPINFPCPFEARSSSKYYLRIQSVPQRKHYI